jgi:hypothetical protein
MLGDQRFRNSGDLIQDSARAVRDANVTPHDLQRRSASSRACAQLQLGAANLNSQPHGDIAPRD